MSPVVRRMVRPGYPITEVLKTRAEVELYFSGDKVMCLLCGYHFRSLPTHLRWHGVDATDYKDTYGIPRTHGLEGQSTHARRSEIGKALDLSEQQHQATAAAARSVRRGGRGVSVKPCFLAEHEVKLRKAYTASAAKRATNPEALKVWRFLYGKVSGRLLARLYRRSSGNVSQVQTGVTEALT